MAGARRQRLEFVDIVLAELIVEKLISHTGQRLFGEYPGQQQRPGVCRGDEDPVDGKQRMDGSHYFQPEMRCRAVPRNSGASDPRRAALPRGFLPHRHHPLNSWHETSHLGGMGGVLASGTPWRYDQH
jgi:hypothetical protein